MVAFLDALYFIIRYTPFWAIPLFLISLQFSYIYWLKDIPRVTVGFGLVAFVCFLFLIYYLWAGSPDRAAQTLVELFKSL